LCNGEIGSWSFVRRPARSYCEQVLEHQYGSKETIEVRLVHGKKVAYQVMGNLLITKTFPEFVNSTDKLSSENFAEF
jgi:hypothetical protein